MRINKQEQDENGKERPAAHPETRAQRSYVPLQARPGKKRVLVMDDDPSLRNMLTVMLRSLGYSVHAAESSDEAVSCYRLGQACGFPFTAVLLDLVMPNGQGGPETLRRIGAMDRDVRAVIMSGDHSHSAVANFSRYGFRRALLKPFTFDELEAALASLHGEQ